MPYSISTEEQLLLCEQMLQDRVSYSDMEVELQILEELERKGVLYSVRGSGWFVGEDIALARQVLAHILEQKTADYFAVMQILGMQAPAVKEYIKEWKV